MRSKKYDAPKNLLKLIDNDHMYLGVTIDRALLPTSSTDAASEWVEDLGVEIESKNYTSENIELFYFDIIGGTISFLEIFLGLVQAFDYIIMIPIVILSLSVLIYGLVLSLEQRRKEIAIHRVIGATSNGLQSMVLLELAVMSTFAWIAGYVLAIAVVPLVLSSVGFMAFESLENVEVNVISNTGADTTTLTINPKLLTTTSNVCVLICSGRRSKCKCWRHCHVSTSSNAMCSVRLCLLPLTLA